MSLGQYLYTVLILPAILYLFTQFLSTSCWSNKILTYTFKMYTIYWFVTVIKSIAKLRGWVIDRQATKHDKTTWYLLPCRTAENCCRFFIICLSTVIYLLSWWPYGHNEMHSNICIGILCYKFFGFHSDAFEVSACLGYETVSMSDLCLKYLRQCNGLNFKGQVPTAEETFFWTFDPWIQDHHAPSEVRRLSSVLWHHVPEELRNQYSCI